MSTISERARAADRWFAGEISTAEYAAILKRTQAAYDLDVRHSGKPPSIAEQENADDLRWYHGRVL